MSNLNKVQQFLNATFGEVRAITKEDNSIWFMATDVANVLQYDLTTNMTRNLDDDEKDIQTLNTLGGEQECLIINESGLYSAVLSITKRNKERYSIAKDFKKWITGVVIPAIRKDGAYISGEENVDLTNEEQEAEFVLRAMNILQNKIERLQRENKELKSKWYKFLDSDGCYSFTEVSKLISTMANEEKSDIDITVIKLTELLREIGILNKSKSKHGYKNLPNKEYEDYFNVSSVPTSGGFNKSQTKVKAKGVEFIYDLVKERMAS